MVKMNIRRICCIALLWVLSSVVALSQTVVWKMPPTDKYDEITPINKNLYKVVRNGKIGLIHADGNVVLEADNDYMSLYYENKAIITHSDGIGERVVGCLTSDGTYIPYAQVYYTIEGLKFFSDGLMTVRDERGQPGYIDAFGAPKLGFNGKYDKIQPFSEGYAAVFKRVSDDYEQYSLINKEGTPEDIKITVRIAEVYGGTGVYQGLAFVWDENEKFYTYNVRTKKPCEKATVRDYALDYLGRFQEVTGYGSDVPFKSYHYSGVAGLEPKEDGGKFGFSVSNNVVVPCQFASATKFVDGNAVVSLNGKLGIISYIEEGVFNIATQKTNFRFWAGDKVSYGFTVEVPSAWKEKDVLIKVKESDAEVDIYKSGDNAYTILEQPTATCTKQFSVSLSCEGITLAEKQLLYSFEKREKCKVCGKDKQECQYKGKHPEEDICPDCGKKIKDCEFRGVH